MLKSRLSVAAVTVVLVAVLCAILAVIRHVSIERGYQTAFDETKIGESLNSVLLRFGEPSDVAGRIQPGAGTGRQPPCENECWLRLWYMAPILGGVSPYSVDFGADQKVIGKYRWSSP
jgi:hypothetical protein